MHHVFETPIQDASSVFVHEKLAAALNVCSKQVVDVLVLDKMHRNIWFFLEIITKSMAQFLLRTGTISRPRRERFPKVCHHSFNLVTSCDAPILQSFVSELNKCIQLLVTALVDKSSKDLSMTSSINVSLAQFFKRLFSLMDRGFVFTFMEKGVAIMTNNQRRLPHLV